MKNVILLTSVLALSACAQSQDRITFVTTSQIGIATDSDTGTASVGYDRQELIIAPVDSQTGQIDPLYANIQQGGDLLNPAIKQTFATGDAAEIISVGTGSGALQQIDTIKTAAAERRAANTQDNQDEDNNPRKVLVFGTQSNVGFKLSLGVSQAPEVNVGYKRKERATIPKLEENDDGAKRAASLFGSLSVRAGTPVGTQTPNADFTLKQVIATGAAAENAASSSDARAEVTKAVLAATQKECANGTTVSNDQDCPTVTTVVTEDPLTATGN
jgi:hypothetical protein